MKLITALSVLTSAVLLHANAQAAEILIDDFSTGQGPISDSVVGADTGFGDDGITPNTNFGQANGANIVGGFRDIYVEEVDNGIGADDPTLGIHAQASNDRLSVTLDDLVKGFAVVTYDGGNAVGSDWETGVDTSGLGGADWSGTTGFLFEDVSNDLIAPAQLIVWTDDAMDGVFVKHVLDFETFGDINAGGLYDALIPIAWFDDAGSINWAGVGAFQAIFNLDSTQNLDESKTSVDLSLSRATAVDIPEPAALSMFGAGLLMLGFAGARRRKEQ